MKKILSLTLILVLILAACGAADEPIVIPDFELADHGTDWPGATQPFVEQAQFPRPQFVRDNDSPMAQILDALYTFRINQHTLEAHLHPFYGETLTFSVLWNFNRPYIWPLFPLEFTAARYLADSYMRQNPGVNIEITFYIGFYGTELLPVDIPAAHENVRNQLTEGTADTLFSMSSGMGIAFDPLSPHTAAHLADWYPIMRSDPRFNADDWFMNLFYAMMVNGSLRSFPIAFMYPSLAANNAVPGLAEAFEQLDFITYADMLSLHEFFASHLDIHENFDPLYALMYTLGEFVNVYTDTANFVMRFPELMEEARRLTAYEDAGVARGYTPNVFRGGMPDGAFIPPDNTAARHQLSELYAFYDTFWFSEFFSMMEFDTESAFSSPRPMTDSAGRLIADAFPVTFELNAAASELQQALAWDFLFHMLQPENQHRDAHIVNAVYVPLLRQQTANQVTRTANWAERQGYSLVYDLETTIEMVTERVINIGRMPMRSLHPIYSAILSASLGLIQQFNDDEIDIADAAQILQGTAERLLSDFR